MRFYVNIDHVATIREARRTDEPDPVRAAVLVELAGADGITVHLREDRRHASDRDVKLLRRTVRTVLNLEMATAPDIVELACSLRPQQVTLVPEKREEVTTEGGLDVGNPETRSRLEPVIERLQDAGIRVSLFIDPTEEALEASKELGVPAVEIHTGEYAHAFTEQHGGTIRDDNRVPGRTTVTEELDRLQHAATYGSSLGLAIHAGHGLTYENVVPVAAIPEIEELNIGHSIVAHAVLVGMERAVSEMAMLIRDGQEQAEIAARESALLEESL